MSEVACKNADWLEENSPYLAFLLPTLEESQETFPPVDLPIEDAEVLYIEGVRNFFPSSFLEKGGRIVFIEKDLKKIKSFLKEVLIDPTFAIAIITDDPIGYSSIPKGHLLLRKQFIGELSSLRSWLDQVHMSISDYTDFGSRILSNVVTNLLHTESYVDGRDLKGVHLGVPAFVVGSGPSLKESLKDCSWAKTGLVLGTGSAIPQLLKANIEIDYGALIDPNPPKELYQETMDFPLFYQHRVCQDLFALHKREKIWMGDSGGWPLERHLLEKSGMKPYLFDAGWNVGTFGLALLYHLGCNPIILVGMDGGEKREVTSEEFSVEGFATRRDLYEGILWMERFIQEHPDREYIRMGEGIPIKGTSYASDLKAYSKQERVLPVKALNRDALHHALSAFRLDEIKEGIRSALKSGERDTLLLEHIQLIGEPLYEYLLQPLWNIFSPLMYKEGKEIAQVISELTFFLKVLEKQTLSLQPLLDLKGERLKHSKGMLLEGSLEGVITRHYPDGSLYGKEYYRKGKKDGVFETYFADGRVEKMVSYKDDLLHGPFTLYSERGIQREGVYARGKKIGMHRLFNEEGICILESTFKDDAPFGKQIRFNEDGILVEELFYHTKEKFDKKVFTGEGRLKYEGVFVDDTYVEKRFLGEKKISERTGKWEKGALVWN